VIVLFAFCTLYGSVFVINCLSSIFETTFLKTNFSSDLGSDSATNQSFLLIYNVPRARVCVCVRACVCVCVSFLLHLFCASYVIGHMLLN
jgi:hypothetical protein